MKYPKKTLVLAFLLISFLSNSSNYSFYNITKKGIQEGLPHIDILSIAEDDKGFVWFVTRAGLCRYDGYNILTYTVENTSLNYNRMNSMVLRGNSIWIGTNNGIVEFNIEKETFKLDFCSPKYSEVNIHECRIISIDSKERMWVSANNKLYILKITNNQIVRIQNFEDIYPPFKKYIVLDVKEDCNNNLWISTNLGLFQFVDENNRLFLNLFLNSKSKQFPLTEEYIKSMHFDWNGDLYLGCFQMLHKITFKKNKSSKISQIERLDKVFFNKLNITNATNTIDKARLSIVNSIVHDNLNQLWIATQTGLIKYNPKLPSEAVLIQESQNKPFALVSEMIVSLLVNRDGSLFIGTVRGGLNILDTRQKKINFIIKDFERPQFSLVDNVIRSIEEEDNGDLWLGMQSKGLCHFSSKSLQITNYEFQGSANNLFNKKNYIRSLYLEDNRYLWIGSLESVICFDVQSRKEIQLSSDFYQKTQINDGYYTDINVDSYGNLWLGGWGKGIVKCKRKPNSKIEFENIQIIDNNKANTFHLNSNTANSFCISKENRVIVGTQNGFEVIELNINGEIRKITHNGKDATKKNQLSNHFVWDIIQIDKSNFYMGTLGGGVNKVTLIESENKSIDGNYKAEVIDKHAVPKVSNVECLIRDKQNNLWVAGNTLMLYNEKKGKFEPFDFTQSTTSSFFKVGSCLLGKSGKVYLGGSQGLIYFNPIEIEPNKMMPKNEITQLLIHNLYEKPDSESSSILSKSIAYNKEISLSYKQNNFTIWFSSLQYVDPNNTNYKYKLEGYDDDWIKTTGKKPFASYLNLPYGSYNLKIISSNIDGVWNENPRELKIKIRPPFYQTKIAYLIYLILIAWLIRFFIKSKTRYYAVKKDLEVEKEKELHNEELFQEKASFFTHLSHELRTPLTLIFSPLKEIIDNEVDSRLKNQLNFVYKNVEKMLYMVNKLIEFRKVESGVAKLEVCYADINSFVNQIAQQFNDWSVRKKISYTINISVEPVMIWFDPEKIESVIYNLLTNAFKYTPEHGTIYISLITEHAEISMKNMRKTFSIGQLPTDGLSIHISDNGSGVQTKNIEHLFDSFYRDNVRVSDGFGIGLSLVKRLIELHRGYLEISSESGVGTDIMLCFSKSENFYSNEEKLQNVSQRIIEQHHVSPEIIHTDIEYNDYIVNDETFKHLSGNKITGKILIIEDDLQIRNYLRLNLNKLFTVFDVAKGRKGYELIISSKPDLVICDYILPDMDGIEIVRKIKSNPETSHIPIIMITAKTDFSVKYEATRAGVDHFIEKPFSISFLISVIINTLSNRNSLINKLNKNVFQEAYLLTSNQKDNELIKRVIQLINLKIEDSEFIVDDLCAEVGLARSVFYTRIKQITGKTPNDLIRDIRLEVAISKMANNGFSISEAAFKVGMTPTYFSKAFRQKYGKTPTEYIKDKSK